MGGGGGLKGGGRRDTRSWWALVEDHSRPGWKEGEARKVKMAARGGGSRGEGGRREKSGESDCCDEHPRQPPPPCFYLFTQKPLVLYSPFFKNPFSLLLYPIFLISSPLNSFWNAPVSLPALLPFPFAALCFPFFLACFFSTSIGVSVRVCRGWFPLLWGLNLAFSSHSVCLISSYFIFTFRSWLSLPSLACWNNNQLHQRWRGAPDTRCTFPAQVRRRISTLMNIGFLLSTRKGRGRGAGHQ